MRQETRRFSPRALLQSLVPRNTQDSCPEPFVSLDQLELKDTPANKRSASDEAQSNTHKKTCTTTHTFDLPIAASMLQDRPEAYNRYKPLQWTLDSDSKQWLHAKSIPQDVIEHRRRLARLNKLGTHPAVPDITLTSPSGLTTRILYTYTTPSKMRYAGLRRRQINCAGLHAHWVSRKELLRQLGSLDERLLCHACRRQDRPSCDHVFGQIIAKHMQRPPIAHEAVA